MSLGQAAPGAISGQYTDLYAALESECSENKLGIIRVRGNLARSATGSRPGWAREACARRRVLHVSSIKPATSRKLGRVQWLSGDMVPWPRFPGPPPRSSPPACPSREPRRRDATPLQPVPGRRPGAGRLLIAAPGTARRLGACAVDTAPARRRAGCTWLGRRTRPAGLVEGLGR